MPPNSPRLRLRRDIANTWAQINPVLADGEPGYEKDTGKLKVGDGVSVWSDLPYFVPYHPSDGPPEPTSDAALAAHIASLTPHPVYDDGPSYELLYQNAKV